VEDPEINPAPAPSGPVTGEPQPLVLIPVTAEDASRSRRRVILTCWAVAIAIAGTAGYIYKRSVDPIHARESYDAGERLYKTARYSQAILNFDRAVALRPDFGDAYYARGKAYAAQAQTENAIRDFGKVIALRPSDPRPRLDRANAYLDSKAFGSAIADVTRAIALDAKLSEAYNLRGTAIRATGDAKAALEDFNRAVALTPNLANYFQRGATYQLLGEHRLAIADFDQAIEFAPDQPQAYFARAESRRAIGDKAGADKDHVTGRILDGH